MPISGLVVTLSDDEDKSARVVATLEADARILVGERQKNRLPVVAETDTIGEGSQLVRQDLLEIDGVVFVDVVSVNFEDITGNEE